MMECPPEAQALADVFEQLLAIKLDDGVPDEPALAAGVLKLLELKQAHRALCESTEALREETALAKAGLDQSSLQLQNLLYERGHYDREIRDCRDFSSAFSNAELELLSAEEFRAAWAGPDAGGDAHATMLNRLTHELASR